MKRAVLDWAWLEMPCKRSQSLFLKTPASPASPAATVSLLVWLPKVHIAVMIQLITHNIHYTFVRSSRTVAQNINHCLYLPILNVVHVVRYPFVLRDRSRQTPRDRGNNQYSYSAKGTSLALNITALFLALRVEN